MSTPFRPLQMSLDELKTWLASNEPFEPPIGHNQFKKTTLIMAIALVVKSIDDRPKRMNQELHDKICDLRDAVENFNLDNLESYLKGFLTQLSKENVKTCPVSLAPVKVLLYAMADNNMIKPPKGEDITSKVLNTRAVLYTLSKSMAKQAETDDKKETTAETILQDQPPPQTGSCPTEPSSETPPPEKPASS